MITGQFEKHYSGFDDEPANEKEQRMTKTEAYHILGDASFYLGDAYPFILGDYSRQTPERVACEIILALKDLLELTGLEETE